MFSSLFSSCMSSSSSSPSAPTQGDPFGKTRPLLSLPDCITDRSPPNADIRVKGCVFCELDKNVPASSVIYQDESFVVFKDKSQGAKQHLLCIPKAHVAKSVKSLSSRDIPMLQTMAALSLDALGRSTSISSLGQTKLGFHIPPFTSVDHLHLHAFELPHKRLANVEFKSTWLSKPRLGKGWGWFVDIDQTIDILRNGQSVKIKPVHVGQNGG